MPRILSIPEMGLIIDSIYRNYSRSYFDQKSMSQLCKDAKCSINTLQNVRNILRDLKLLIIKGERRAQVVYWNPEKCSPNSSLVTNVYRVYYKDIKKNIKGTRKPKSITEEQALQVLAKLGWTQVIKETNKGYKSVTEVVNLSKIKLGE